MVQRLRRALAVVPGHPGLSAADPADPDRRNATSRALYQFTLSGSDLAELYAVAARLEAKIRALPGLQDVNSDMQLSGPQVSVDIDRDRAATLGITPEQIEDTLYSAYGSRQVSTIYTPTNQYYVIMEVADRVPARCGRAAPALSALGRRQAGAA